MVLRAIDFYIETAFADDNCEVKVVLLNGKLRNRSYPRLIEVRVKPPFPIGDSLWMRDRGIVRPNHSQILSGRYLLAGPDLLYIGGELTKVIDPTSKSCSSVADDMQQATCAGDCDIEEIAITTQEC
jgi:hypothetical protein